MTCFSVLSVVILAVGGKEPLHYSANQRLLHLDQEMHMVRHQAVGIKVKGQLQLLLRENGSEPDKVIATSECFPAIVATRHDVV